MYLYIVNIPNLPVFVLQVGFGRGDTNDVILTESLAVSRKHAVMEKKGQIWTIMDLVCFFLLHYRLPKSQYY